VFPLQPIKNSLVLRFAHAKIPFMVMKQKKCKVCKNPFTPGLPLQRVCNYQCAIDLANQRKDRQERTRKAAVRRSDKERLKTRADHLREAQAAFNQWVRLVKDKDQPCISCGTQKPDIQYHASHYRSVGACPELRFEPLNVWKSCSKCNKWLSGNLIPYREALKTKGVDLEWLEGPHPPLKLTIDDIKAIKAKYKKLLKDLK